MPNLKTIVLYNHPIALHSAHPIASTVFWDNVPKAVTGHCHKNYANTLKIPFLTVI